jgi:predicted dehydrogenase
MQTTSPIVDCGVHYVDVMCQITDARPVRVQGIGLRLSDEIAPGHVQLRPVSGGVRRRLGRLVRGRLGPMMSETAFFVKDIISPNGAVSITDADKGASADIDGHTKVGGCWSTGPRATG